MSLPTVVIIGRPNVGKSTLFNRMTRKRQAIVNPTPGVTRDLLNGVVRMKSLSFNLVDTGGVDSSDSSVIQELIEKFALESAAEATVVIFLVDAKSGLVAEDISIAEKLRKMEKKVFLVVNKCDNKKLDQNAADFFRLGFEEKFNLSAEHGNGVKEFMNRLSGYLPEAELEAEKELPEIAVAIVGKPNVGKSSLVNKLLGKERMMVTDIAGTTRDSVDSIIEMDNTKFRLIDTAGMRRQSRIKEDPERLSVMMAKKAIERAQVAIHVLDPTEELAKQDLTIGRYVQDRGTGIIFVINKWDLVQATPELADEIIAYLRKKMDYLDYAPVILTSAESGRNIHKLMNLVRKVYDNCMKRIPTSSVNSFMEQSLRHYPPPAARGKGFKLFYSTQVAVNPPTFVVFSNNPPAIKESYKRYLKNRMRETFDFEGTPIRLKIRLREKK